MSVFILVIVVLLGVSANAAPRLTRSLSQNVPALLDRLPHTVEQPLAREIRYTYASVLDVPPASADPFLVSDEPGDYQRQVTPGTAWMDLHQHASAQASQMRQSNADFLDTHADRMSASTLAAYNDVSNQLQGTMNAIATYTAVMGTLAEAAKAARHREAQNLVDWVTTTTGVVGPSAPDGSVLHLDFRWLTRGQAFKLHSTNEIAVLVTLETGDGRFIVSEQVMTLWVDSRKVQVSPPEAQPFLTLMDASRQEQLTPLFQKHGILPLFAILINAGIEDIETRIEVIDALTNP